MLKTKVSLAVAIAMLVTLLAPMVAMGQEKDYAGHWAEDTIQKWFDNEMIKGYEDGSFKSDNSISRAEFMTMVNNSYKFTEKAIISFDDVNEDIWYYEEVQKAVQAGFIVGDNAETARPEDEISREEVAVIINRLNELDKNTEVDKFADADEISDWAVEYVGAVLKAEYMIGNDKGEFNPTDDITRAEALVTIDRAMEDKVEEEYASLTALSIVGAELEQEFNAETTTYSAINADAETVVIKAVTTTNSAISFNGIEGIEVTTSTAVDGGIAYTANIPLAKSIDTVVEFTVSAPNMKDKVYTITIKW